MNLHLIISDASFMALMQHLPWLVGCVCIVIKLKR